MTNMQRRSFPPFSYGTSIAQPQRDFTNFFAPDRTTDRMGQAIPTMSEGRTMYTMRTITALIGATLLAISAPAILSLSTAQAETYVAGQLGVTLPSIGKGLSDVDLTGSFIPGSTTSDQALKSSIMYGGKIGHYFRAAPGSAWKQKSIERRLISNNKPSNSAVRMVLSGPPSWPASI